MASTTTSPLPADDLDSIDLDAIDLGDAANPRRWAILAVLCTSLLLVMLGNTALNLALPNIAADLGLSSSAQQWVVDSYSLVFAGLLFTTSSLGDRFGRKGVMQAGLGVFTLAAGFAAFFATIVYGLIEAPSHGWAWTGTLGYLIGGITLVGGFIAWELRTSSPMLDVRLFRRATFGISSLALTLVFFALMGVFFSISQLFQLIMGYGTFESALRLAPIFVAMIVVGPRSPRLVQRFGARAVVAGGLAM